MKTKKMRYAALALSCAGVLSGCYTMKDVEAHALADPVRHTPSPVEKPEKQDPAGRYWLVGKWRASSLLDGKDYRTWDLGVKSSPFGFSFAAVYDFRENGEVAVDVSAKGLNASAGGTWKYDNGILRLEFNRVNNAWNEVSVSDFLFHADEQLARGLIKRELYDREERDLIWFGKDMFTMRWRMPQKHAEWWDVFMGSFDMSGESYDNRSGSQDIVTTVEYGDDDTWKIRNVRDGGRLFGSRMVDVVGDVMIFRRVSPRPAEPGNGAGPAADTGKVRDAAGRQDVSRPVPGYSISYCGREAGKDFSYKFALKLSEGTPHSLDTFRTVQREFRNVILQDYRESFRSSGGGSALFVDFPEYELVDGKIKGRAVVLTVSVTAMTYDPHTREGKLAVKVNANQYEEARKWVRKNIETLARDKNIALTTGEIPPAARFYLGREELKEGDILEVEFRTE